MATFDLVMPPIPVPFEWITRYELEERTYWFEFAYNDRSGFWFLRVAGSERTTQVTGIQLTLGVNKLDPYKYADVPPGSLDVVDVTGDNVEANIDDFGSRVILRYTEFVAPDDTLDELFPLAITPPS